MFARVDHRHRSEVRRAAQILNQHPAQVAEAELQILLVTVEDLLRSLAHAADPEIVRLRKQTEAALARAQAAIAKGGEELRDQAAQFVEEGAARLREHPWTWLGVAALCALAIGLWTSRTMMSDSVEQL